MLVTNRDDLTADWLVLELEARGAPFVRLNTEDYPTRAALTWTLEGATLSGPAGDIGGAEIDAVWWRRPLAPHMPAQLPEPEARWAASEAAAALDGFWRTIGGRWVNRPASNAQAGNKLEQLARAQRIGFDVPPTLVTNDPDAAREFAAVQAEVVCKALHEGAVPHDGGLGAFRTSRVSGGELAAIGPEPCLIQTLVPKRYDVRVTVIGDASWSCSIDSQAEPEARVDWRVPPTADLRHTVEDLPADIARRCVDLTHSYGLRYAAIDLARRPDGGFTFFELNPNGQWAWVEQRTELPLRARLADELLGGT